MMPILHLIILAIVQGATEFIPVSSSGHLVLTHSILGNNDLQMSRMIDVAVHLGTLIAVLAYFWRDIHTMLCGLKRAVFKREPSEGSRLVVNLIIGSLPVIMIGFALHAAMPAWLGSIKVIAWTTLIFGILLWVADAYFPKVKRVEALTWRDSFLIGLAQALALIPGVSRSGITMTAGRFLNMSAVEAARFSLLLGMVAISGAGVLMGLDILAADVGSMIATRFILPMLFAALAGWLSIAFMMKLLLRTGFLPFVIYRIALGLVLLFIVYA